MRTPQLFHSISIAHSRKHLLSVMALLLLPGVALSQQAPLPSQEALEQQARDQQALEQDASHLQPGVSSEVPPNSHATVEAPPELGGLASREPWHFIGRKLVLSEGTQTKDVGTIFAVRRRIEDQLVYLIVDATEFFNSPTQYAVAVKNLERMEGNTIITPAAPGMHLLGMQYYAKDYEDINTAAQLPSPDD